MIKPKMHQIEMFDIDPPYVAWQETSKDAAESVKPYAVSMRTSVFGIIQASVYGCTCDEVEKRLRAKHQTISARIRELARMRFIVDSGFRRKTRSGRDAVVWRAC
jgi:hypothetical protein